MDAAAVAAARPDVSRRPKPGEENAEAAFAAAADSLLAPRSIPSETPIALSVSATSGSTPSPWYVPVPGPWRALTIASDRAISDATFGAIPPNRESSAYPKSPRDEARSDARLADASRIAANPPHPARSSR